MQFNANMITKISLRYLICVNTCWRVHHFPNLSAITKQGQVQTNGSVELVQKEYPLYEYCIFNCLIVNTVIKAGRVEGSREMLLLMIVFLSLC